MKNKSIAVIFSLASILLLSCSTSPSFNADEEKVIKTFLKTRGYKPEYFTFFEVKFVRDVTAEDSINYSLKDTRLTDDIINEYNKALENLKYRIEHKDDLQHKEFQDDWLEKDIAEVNRFANAFEGKYDEKSWKYNSLFKNLYRLKNLNPKMVVGKIYSITYHNNHNKIKTTDTFVFQPNLEKINGGTIHENEIALPPKFDLERIHFKHYVKE